MFSLHIHTYRIIYRIIYIHRMSRDIVELVVAETSRLSACSKEPTCSWWLSSRATTLRVTIRAHCIFAHLRSLYILSACESKRAIYRWTWEKKRGGGIKFSRTLLGIIKRHIERATAIGMHLTRKEANRFAKRLFTVENHTSPIFYTRLCWGSTVQLIYN